MSRGRCAARAMPLLLALLGPSLSRAGDRGPEAGATRGLDGGVDGAGGGGGPASGAGGGESSRGAATAGVGAAAGAAAPPPALVRVVDKRPFVLLGCGLRHSAPGDLYAITLYVDEVGARRAFPALASRAGGRSRDKLLGGDKAPPFVVWGDFGKLAVLRLQRDAAAAEVRGIFEEGLEAVLAERSPQELRERARALIALLDRDLPRGAIVELLTTPGGLIELQLAGTRHEVATDARLARALWEIWLGGKPVQTDLRRALVDRIDLLGR